MAKNKGPTIEEGNFLNNPPLDVPATDATDIRPPEGGTTSEVIKPPTMSACDVLHRVYGWPLRMARRRSAEGTEEQRQAIIDAYARGDVDAVKKAVGEIGESKKTKE